MSRRNIDVLAGVGAEQMLLDFDQTVENLSRIDQNRGERCDVDIAKEIVAPIDVPVELLQNEKMDSIELTFDRMNAVERQQTRQIVNDDENDGVRAEDLRRIGEIAMPTVITSEGTRENVVVEHFGWRSALQQS